MILSNFPKNFMKARKFWAVGGLELGTPPPLDPPLVNLYVSLRLRVQKCGVPSTLCWKIGKISTSTDLFGFNFVDNNSKLPNLSIHAFVIIQKSLEVH